MRIRTAVSEGLSLAASRNGAVLVGLFFAIEVLSLLLVLAGTSTYLPLDVGTGTIPGTTTSTSELPKEITVIVALLIGLFTSIITLPVQIIAIRVFVSGVTDRIPDAVLFRRIGRATVTGFVGLLGYVGLLFAVPISIGLLTIGLVRVLPAWTELIVVAMFAPVSILGMLAVWLYFVFVIHEISVRDQGVIGAAIGSARTVRGHELKLLVLSVGLALIRGSLGWGPSVRHTTWTPSEITIVTLAIVGSAIASVFTTAILARAYRQGRPDVIDTRSHRDTTPDTQTR